MSSDYLLVHKKILPDYFEKVIEARELLENKEVETITEAVRKCGISRNTYYKYKNYIYTPGQFSHERHAVLSIILKDEAGALAAVMKQLTDLGTSILTISQAVPIHRKANVLISLNISNMKCSTDEMLEALKKITFIKSVHLDGIDSI